VLDCGCYDGKRNHRDFILSLIMKEGRDILSPGRSLLS
jgi:hypothetical protein